jgi:hypothetical protein
VLPGLTNGLKCPHTSTQITALQTNDVGLRFIDVSPQCCGVERGTMPFQPVHLAIILSRRSHNARSNTSACAASCSPIEEVSQPVPDGASQAPVGVPREIAGPRLRRAHTGEPLRRTTLPQSLYPS